MSIAYVVVTVLAAITEADDAVQDTWLRLSRSGTDEVDSIADPERVSRIVAAALAGQEQ